MGVPDQALLPDDAVPGPVAGSLPTLGGPRLTRQRRMVFEALRNQPDHPSAAQLYVRVKERVPHISLATVYNCLETLVQRGLARQVNLDREATRYCANQRRHGHFFCSRCGRVEDVEPAAAPGAPPAWRLPAGFVVTHAETNLRGLCPDCADAAGPAPEGCPPVGPAAPAATP